MNKEFWRIMGLTDRQKAMRDLILNDPGAKFRIAMRRANKEAEKIFRKSRLKI